MQSRSVKPFPSDSPGEPCRNPSDGDLPDAKKATAVTILVVEDEQEILAPLAHSLKREGYRVLEAEDGLTACKLIGSEEPDLILLDIMLPDLDGWEVCRMLRQHPVKRIATTPVIMLTALNAQQDKIRGLALGADAYLAKPYSIREILLYVANLIERRQQMVELENRLEQFSRQEYERVNFNHLLFHELRNRLLILNGYTELLSSGVNPDNCVEAISQSSSYLNNLAENILLIRQVKDGRYTLQRESLLLTDILEELRQLYAAQAEAAETSLIISIEPGHRPVRLNRPALKIILSTLLDNAIKYGPAGQTVTLNCRQTPEILEIMIIDEGPGIPTEEVEKVFEPFYRAENTSRQVPGSGLGLHGVQVLSRAMGGDVMFETGHLDGCCVRMHLPLPTK